MRAGSSEVDTTTTERARPSSPRSSCRNSCTSRPRSPTRPITDTSASTLRANIDSSTDLPTPEPAKMPSRWPRQQVTKVFIARTPSSSGLDHHPCADRHRVNGPCDLDHQTAHADDPAINVDGIDVGDLLGECL